MICEDVLTKHEGVVVDWDEPVMRKETSIQGKDDYLKSQQKMLQVIS